MPTLKGYIERITFCNPESGFVVARLQEEKKEGLTTIVGAMPTVQPGETVSLEGEWKCDPNHGWQFAVTQAQIVAPASIIGIEKYLGSGLVKGIGSKFAKRIVTAFGEQTLEVIDKSPHRLLEVEGIGKGRLAKIEECWSEQRTIREVMVFLQSHGVSPTYAQKIFKIYRDESISKVRQNPYALAKDIHGIGFKTADAIAQQMGIALTAPQRVEAGIEHVLSQCCDSGHTCYPQEPFIEKAAEVLCVERPLIETQIEELLSQKRIVVEGERVWLKSLYMNECGIARELQRLQKNSCALREVDQNKALSWVEEKLSLRLADQQREAVAQALREKVQIITGGPGTGKSTITKAILAISRHLTPRILLAAPTGRAAKRMNEITGYPARTIHALLEFDFKAGGFKRGHDHPLDCDLLIVDEASMIDTVLMFSLLKAVPTSARVIFVGDIDQLPSVGPGNVLRDLIQSQKIPLTRLDKVFRQAQGSKIIMNAHRIRKGIFPDLQTESKGDFFFCKAQEVEQVQQIIIDLVHRRLPAAYGFDPVKEIQVLAPMRRGLVGTDQLNALLQETLNPCDLPLIRMGRRFHLHDKVMQLRNNYDKEVFNGDVGTVAAIDLADQTLVVDFEGRLIPYPFLDLDELNIAYAVSVHKFQGSECPCIVMPVHTTHFALLERNLLYTGVTRAKKLFVLVGTKQAIAIAVNNATAGTRHTGLKERLTNPS
ncbi:MAG: ATP-dependent RecD-like DNA helicase [Verrucomicrobia bacterium]|nr:ATP-dependent RecD-like DNA helicase [Verrucomicrobiota bacterium]